jgi:glutamine synthetase
VNPYLGMAAFVAAGLDGIRRRLDPGEPNTRKNMYRLTLDDVKDGKIGLIPQSLAEAVVAFEGDPVVRQALGPELAEEFIKVKRQEWVRYHNTVSRWEIDRYLTLF